MHQVIREVLEKLPDEHAMRAIRLDDELERELEGEGSPVQALTDDEGPGPSAA